MYSKLEFDRLTEKYGKFASWALWDKTDESNTKIIKQNIDLLNSKYVGIGLNISQPVSVWSNFRGGKHDRKLKYAFNDFKYRGFYLTDIFKGIVESKSKVILKQINNNQISINEHLEYFIEEMKAIKINKSTIFIVFGVENSIVSKVFKRYFVPHFIKNDIINYYHYSYYSITDREWVNGIRKLCIKGDIDQIIKSYKNTYN